MIDLGDGISARLINIETLIKSKKFAGRDKDKIAVKLLEAILELKKKRKS